MRSGCRYTGVTMQGVHLKSFQLICAAISFAGVILFSSTTRVMAAAGVSNSFVVERGPVKKVFETESDGHRFVAYMVEWNGTDVIVSDTLAHSDFKAGDEISFLVMKNKREGAGGFSNISFALSGASAGRPRKTAKVPSVSPAEKTRAMKLVRGDLSVAKSDQERFLALPAAALSAFKSGETEKASELAEELLKLRANFPKRSHGSATFHGNDVLGRIALAKGDLEEAEMRLLASTEHEGSPVLNSFGPTMTLAKGLLQQGGKAAVIQYFERCRKFWEMDRGQLDKWTADVKAGHTPDFGTSLRE